MNRVLISTAFTFRCQVYGIVSANTIELTAASLVELCLIVGILLDLVSLTDHSCIELPLDYKSHKEGARN